MKYAHLAAQEMTVTAHNWSGPVVILTALDGRVVNRGVKRYRELNNRHLQPLAAARVDDETIRLKVQTSQSEIESPRRKNPPVPGNQRLSSPPDTIQEEGYIAQEFKLELPRDHPLTIDKTVSLFTSRDKAILDCGTKPKKR